MDYPRIILFDGVCQLCNATVAFVLAHDKNKVFKFAPLQSEIAHQLLKKFQYPKDELATVVFIDGDQIYLKSTAVLQIAKYLDRPFRYAQVLILIPPFLRDAVYTWVASHRKPPSLQM